MLFCLLGAAGLVLIAVAISRLFALRDPVPAERRRAGDRPRVAGGPPGRHAAPRRPDGGQPASDEDGP